MATGTRASFTDDDSICEHTPLEMVRMDAPKTAFHNDLDELGMLDESAGTLGSSAFTQNDFLLNSSTAGIEGINREYEIPNAFTYRKVSRRACANEVKARSGLVDRSATRADAG